MQIRMGLLNKKPGWTTDRFRAHWRDHHAQLAKTLPGLRSYQQNHVTDSTQRGISFSRGPEQLDGFSQLRFDDDESMRMALSTPVGKSLIEDEIYFMGHLRIVTVEQHVVVSPPTGSTAIKRMSLLRRRPGISAYDFAHEWQAVHGPLVMGLQGVLGYRQNLVTGRQAPKGTLVDYEGLPIDGIVELWFENTDTLNAAFSAPSGQDTMAHAATFIGEITTYLVEPIFVV